MSRTEYGGLSFPFNLNISTESNTTSRTRANKKVMAKEQSQVRERQWTDIREPRRYKVIIYNDDFTTMEFVVMVLKQVFLKSEEEAQALMLQVHHSDKAVVGIYSYDIAMSKTRKATNMAREQGYPLRLTVEGCD
jgi:ATP-dependent Clp protease adaptor protein ClpS